MPFGLFDSSPAAKSSSDEPEQEERGRERERGEKAR